MTGTCGGGGANICGVAACMPTGCPMPAPGSVCGPVADGCGAHQQLPVPGRCALCQRTLRRASLHAADVRPGRRELRLGRRRLRRHPDLRYLRRAADVRWRRNREPLRRWRQLTRKRDRRVS